MNFNTSVINWKQISKGLPKARRAADARAPTIEELKKLSEYPDRRMKPLVYLMASTGIRIGAFEFMRWGDITPITKEDKVIAAKLVVYPTDEEQYFTFMTPEAYTTVKEWMDYRKDHGETITNDSWVMRDLWQTTKNYGGYFGKAANPKQLQVIGIKSLITRAINAQCVNKLKGKKSEWKPAHGIRKFFKTTAERKMKSVNVEILMGHSIGVSDSYYKPTEEEVLEDYLKAIDSLTVNRDSQLLTEKVAVLEEKNKQQDYTIRGIMQTKDEEISKLQDQFSQINEQMKSIMGAFDFMNEDDKEGYC